MIMIYIYIVPFIHQNHKVLCISIDKNTLYSNHCIHRGIAAISRARQQAVQEYLIIAFMKYPFFLTAGALRVLYSDFVIKSDGKNTLKTTMS